MSPIYGRVLPHHDAMGRLLRGGPERSLNSLNLETSNAGQH